MKESELLGTLLPSLSDFISIEKVIRDKYNLPEISLDDEPIKEIFLGDEIIQLEELRNDINRLVHENLFFLPPDIRKQYLSAKAFSKSNYELQHQEELASLQPDIKTGVDASFKLIESFSNLVIQIVEPMIDSIVDMLYIHLLAGETQGVPNDWISKVTTFTAMGETMIIAMVGPMANLDSIIQQLREEYKKSFGTYRPKITETHKSTAYYVQLKLSGKPWKYIADEYIRINNFVLPKVRNSPRYHEVRLMYEARLRKRIQRTEAIFKVLFKDKK